MGRNPSTEDRSGPATPYTVACERVLRYLRLAGFARGGRRIRTHASDDRGTHWLLTFGVSSIEDPTRDFMHASIVAEKETGFVYSFPSRSRQPIDAADIASIRRGCTRITPDDLNEMEAEEQRRVWGPTCFACGSSNVHCDGGRLFRVSGLDQEFIQWVHTCRDCGREASQWVSEHPAASEWRCPHFDCESVRRVEDH
jgi:hypothetical protein